MARARRWYSKSELKDAKVAAKTLGRKIWRYCITRVHRDGAKEKIGGLYMGNELPKELLGDWVTTKLVFPRKPR